MPSTVRQHYVPRTYLKAWADARGQVRVEDRVLDRDFSSSPENVCVERFYYEADATRPDNAIEKMFQPYESNYDPHAATLNAIAASGSNTAQVLADLAAAGADASLDTAIKGLAAVAYFRTPAALEALQNELKHDQSDAAQAAALVSQTPHDMAKLAFDSTLLKRFQGLVPTYFLSKTRLFTCDRACFPLQSAQLSSGNFGWAIGNDPGTHALMQIGPHLLVMLSMESAVHRLKAIQLPPNLYDLTLQIVRANARRFLIL
ncbi:hypothetical protein XarzCFBP7410_04310 [Xanthomonas arboricola pv. zantedeschiae]|uniref:DUF4238 domain-containing protein n=1 Tax=Xanthomonas TaxID=338 RepID=UPI000CEF252A|nr:DUF4238 domain-containing protein [Xanthomonas arboricola]NJB79282.1 hypothetical protein [Xanthomonas arboricola]PPT86414.1 hypothetical protein XarzCFBP7410_04310 [Xanthomonas arboricola pv. zantedeschiae]